MLKSSKDNKSRQVGKERRLTADCGGGGGCLSDAGGELDLHAMILREVRVPLLAALGHPLGEGLADEGVDDVADVLARHLADLPLLGQGLLDDNVGEAEVEDGVEGEVLVLGNVDVLDVLAVDGLEKMKMRIGT